MTGAVNTCGSVWTKIIDKLPYFQQAEQDVLYDTVEDSEDPNIAVQNEPEADNTPAQQEIDSTVINPIIVFESFICDKPIYPH